MPRLIDHLVICVHDLARARQSLRSLGFTLTPTGVLPFGVSNHLALFESNFLEILAVTDAAAVPPSAPGRFSFGAHNQNFLASVEGMSMLALYSANAETDAARFAARGIGLYAPFSFGRDAVLPGGATARLQFSLTFATDPAMPGIAFFTCQQHHAPELFWKPDYQRHPNGALRVVEVVMSAPEPAAHRSFLERLTESTAELSPGQITVGKEGDRITVLDPREMARRLPGLTIHETARFCAARITVGDLDATRRELQRNGVGFAVIDGVLSVPAAAHGLALEFVEQGKT
jgi:Glyoxalase-like domain